MSHFTITAANHSQIHAAIWAIESIVDIPGVCNQPDWFELGCHQVATYRDLAESFEGDQLILNSAPASIPSVDVYALQQGATDLETAIERLEAVHSAMEPVLEGVQEFIALCPACGWEPLAEQVEFLLRQVSERIEDYRIDMWGSSDF
jgi:hypothetical protein